jgi:hypothetical protein
MTLTITMDCNLGCDECECHEKRSGAELRQSEIAAILQLAEVDGDKVGGERCISTRCDGHGLPARHPRTRPGDVPIAVEIEAAAPSLLVIHEW